MISLLATFIKFWNLWQRKTAHNSQNIRIETNSIIIKVCVYVYTKLRKFIERDEMKLTNAEGKVVNFYYCENNFIEFKFIFEVIPMAQLTILQQFSIDNSQITNRNQFVFFPFCFVSGKVRKLYVIILYIKIEKNRRLYK